MFPTDGEFLMLYAAYAVVFLVLVAGLIFSKNKKSFRNHFIFYAAYTAVMIFMFSSEENFKGGSSLVVLFWGGIFILTHIIVFVVGTLLRLFSKQKSRR